MRDRAGPSQPARGGRRGPRLFATPVQVPRARRSTDALLLAGALFGLVVTSFAAAPQPGFSQAVATFLQSLPEILDGLWQLFVDLLALLALVYIVAAGLSRRGGLLRDVLLAIVLAVLAWLVVARWEAGSWPDVWAALGSADPPPDYPAGRIAIPAAVIVTAAPHLSRPIRKLGRRLLGLAAVGVVALGAATPIGALAGVLVAAMAAAIVHLVFGSSGGRPGLDDVRTGLAQLGVPAGFVGAADRQPAGLFLVTAEDLNGEPLVVKVYGRDAHDSALVTTVWRTLWYREPGTPIRFGRLQQVEHEAFLTLLARQAGIATDAVVTAGATPDDDALLVLRPLGPALADGASAMAGPALVPMVWDLVRTLRRAGIAHGQLDDQHFVVAGDRLGLRDFKGATVAASEAQQRTDEAQALITTVLLAGQDEAFRAARDALGAEGLDAALSYLQPVALTARQRRALRDADIDLDDVRAAAAQAAGTPLPELQQLRRVSVGSVVRVVLPAVVAIVLISGIAGLDIEAVIDEVQGATWWLVALGFVLAQTPRVTQAVSFLGASPLQLALGPVYALQLAVSYIGIAVPGTAARIAMNIRFFQRHGVPPGSAVAVGALDGFGGLIVQAGLLLIMLLFSPWSLDLQLDSGSASAAARLVLLVVVIVGVAVGVVLVVRPWRQFVLGWVRRFLTQALSAVRGVQSPRRLGMIIGGNLASELLFALTLGTFTRAFGYSVGIGELLFINITVSLLSGLLPIPGGIGVTEGGLTLGLVRAGLPEEVAFAAVIMYRLATFYVPPVWGFFALRWLERNKHL